MTRKWVDINDLSVGQYSVNKNISFKTPMLRSDFCDYGNAYIVEKRAIGLLAAAVNEIDKAQKDFFYLKIKLHIGLEYQKLTKQ